MLLCEIFPGPKSDDAAKERARALGFDVDEPVYHGTTAGAFDAFKPRYRPGEQFGFGVHVTPDASFAERYATGEHTARKGKAPHVFHGYARKGRILVADTLVKDGSPEFALAKKLAGSKFMALKDEDGVKSAWMQNAIDSTSPRRAESLIRDAGYDTVQYGARIASRLPGCFITRAEAPSYVILDPKNLRRHNARFDASTLLMSTAPI